MRPDAVRRTAGKTITLRRLAQPWTLILVVTGLFQFFRGAPVDGAFFLGVAVLLLADAVGWLSQTGIRRPRAAWLLAAAIPLGIALVLAPRHGVVEGIIVAGIGVSTLLLGWSPQARPSAPSDTNETGAKAPNTDETGASGTSTENTATPLSPAVRRAAILWSVIAVVCCLWEVASFLLGLPSPEAAIEHPSISDLFDPVIDTIQGRIAFTALWLLVGVALLRGSRRWAR
jgi:hypothetical protein